MAPAVGSLEPLPTGVYTGTMSSADIYPTHAGIGGIRTQDRALPAYADSVVQAQTGGVDSGQLHRGLLGTPAGWMVVLVVFLIVGAWYYK